LACVKKHAGCANPCSAVSPFGCTVCSQCCDDTLDAAACSACTEKQCPTSVCYGSSAGLMPAQCRWWQTFYDSTGGPGWQTCKTKRADPCACTGVTCNGTDIKLMCVLQIRLSPRLAVIDLVPFTPLNHSTFCATYAAISTPNI
jgi:hypothetical protein